VTVTCIAPTEGAQQSPGRQWAVAEFFAGIGLVRMGLEPSGFRVVWSNDIDRDKQHMYKSHFGDSEGHQFVRSDIGCVHGYDLPSGLSLAWASFPCVDLSLAGWRRGLHGQESGTFWQFVRILDELEDDRPPVIALENVAGLATSRGGRDLEAAARALNQLGYSLDILMLDARRFVPQSRLRLFMVGAQDPGTSNTVQHSDELRPEALTRIFEDPTVRTHRRVLPPPPAPRPDGLSSLVERLEKSDARWWDVHRTEAFLGSLSPLQRTRLEALKNQSLVSYRTAYRRTRSGKAVWEIRPDDVAGCLRTARGGSSKQALVEAGHGEVRARWMTPREYARLMGADDYSLNGIRRNQALFGFGDAVCVPVVDWLTQHYLIPLLAEQQSSSREALAQAAIG
jgi:DNA (cytosine-5)-methyltransferase 1